MKYTFFTASKIALPFILLSSQTQIAIAADDVKLGNDGGLELSITANRRLQNINKSLAAVTIINRKMIENSQATEITEVLRQVPGLTLQNSGGVGKVTSIHLRGTNSSHVLVLVDGIKVGSATLGSVSFQDIPLDNIERIEVVRGPRSALYGSEAIGGVIQIFTLKGREGFHPQVSVSVGSHQLQKLNVNLAGGIASDKGLGWYNLNVGSQKTDGFDARNLNFGQPDTQTDKDGYRREQLSLGLGHKFINGAEAQLKIQQVKGRDEFDGSGNDIADYKHQIISGKLQTPLGAKTKALLQLGQSKDESDTISGGFGSLFNTKRDTATLLLDRKIGKTGALIGGVDWQKDRIDTTTAYSKNSRKNTGVFASYQSSFNKLDLEVSARQDDNEQFGTKTTGSFAVGYRLNNGIRLSTSFGTAFKAPTFNDLYYPDGQFSVGNPNIKAESSKNLEFGLQGALKTGSWEVNLFQNKVDNLIAWAPRADGKWTPSNTDKAVIRGIEAGHKTVLKNWNINTSLALLSAKNDHGANKGKYLRYRPKKTLNLDISRQFGRFNVGTTIHAESGRYTKQDNTESLAGYATLDLRTEYAISKNWSAGVKVANVLDKKYETNKGYNQDGINGMLTIKYAPK